MERCTWNHRQTCFIPPTCIIPERKENKNHMNTHPFSYEIIYSSRRTLAIQITSAGEVKVRAPRHMSHAAIDRFLTEKENWGLKHLQKVQTQQASKPAPAPLSETARHHYIETARKIFTEKSAYYASVMGVTYGRITIREQKTRWGSCSSAGNLNFNWRLIFAPEPVIDYVVVHELAHRKEMNHSPAFYAIVQSVLPDYKTQQKWLRDNGASLWTMPQGTVREQIAGS